MIMHIVNRSVNYVAVAKKSLFRCFHSYAFIQIHRNFVFHENYYVVNFLYFVDVSSYIFNY